MLYKTVNDRFYFILLILFYTLTASQTQVSNIFIQVLQELGQVNSQYKYTVLI